MKRPYKVLGIGWIFAVVALVVALLGLVGFAVPFLSNPLVLVPQIFLSGLLVPVDQLSRGTRDALTLLLRARVVDLLSTSAESVPLFLDDPLVHVDPERCQAILTVLGELATVRQIFYFTQDPRVVEWVGGGAMVHELAGR